MKHNHYRSWAIFFAREVLGLIFFMAGVYKVFKLGPLGHARKYFLPFSDTFLPVWSLWATGVAIPFVELLAGALLIIGLRIREALIALGFVLVTVTFGHLLKEPLYPFHEHVIPRLALLLFVFMLPSDEDRFSLDHLIQLQNLFLSALIKTVVFVLLSLPFLVVLEKEMGIFAQLLRTVLTIGKKENAEEAPVEEGGSVGIIK